MASPIKSLIDFLGELKRRKVYHVALAYVAIIFIALQAVDLLIPSTTLPEWTDELLLALAITGFPIAVIIAWAVEVTPEGVRFTTPTLGDASDPAPASGRNSLWPLVALVAVILIAAWFAFDWSSSEPFEDDNKTIAVLPFATIGSDQASVFTDGMHAGVLTRLSGIADLGVISRTSVKSYDQAGKTLPEIARALGANWVLSAEVQEAGQNVLVHARLVNGPADRQVWAQDYQRSLSPSTLFDIQNELSIAIIEALQARLTDAEKHRVDRSPTGNLEAYRLELIARQALQLRSDSGLRQAIQTFQRAIELDPAYAQAWQGLGEARAFLYDYGFESAPSLLTRAENDLERAIELDPHNAQAFAALGVVNLARQNGPEAIRLLRRAVSLQPSNADAHSWLCWTEVILGDALAAVENGERAAALNPLSGEAISNLALAYLAHGDFEQALVMARRSLDLLPNWPTGRFYQGLALYHLGRHPEAVQALEGVKVEWSGQGAASVLALSQVALGERDEARSSLKEMRRSGDRFSEALVQTALGDHGPTLQMISNIDRWGAWPAIATRNFFPDVIGKLREDPAFEDVQQELDRSWGLAR